MPRRSRYTPEQKLEIVLRNIKGETQYALQRELLTDKGLGPPYFVLGCKEAGI